MVRWKTNVLPGFANRAELQSIFCWHNLYDLEGQLRWNSIQHPAYIVKYYESILYMWEKSWNRVSFYLWFTTHADLLISPSAMLGGTISLCLYSREKETGNQLHTDEGACSLHPDKHLKMSIVYNYLTFRHKWHSQSTSLWLPSQQTRTSQAVPAVLNAIDIVVIPDVFKRPKAVCDPFSAVIANINVDFVGPRPPFPCHLHGRLLQQRATTCSNEDQVMQSRLERATLRQNAC